MFELVEAGLVDCVTDVTGGVVDDIGFESSLVYVFEVRDDDSLWESDDETVATLSFTEIGGLFSFSEQPHNSDAQTASAVIDLNTLLLIKFTPYHTLKSIPFYNYISFQRRCQVEKNVTRKSFKA